MARTSKEPWLDKERGVWKVTIKGRRHNLGPDKKQAQKTFHELKVAQGMEEPKEAPVTVAEAIEALLASVESLRPNTRQNYLYNLGPFAERYATRRLDSITAEEALGFVTGYEGRKGDKSRFGDASRYLMFRYIKTLFRWARDLGVIPKNPMHRKDGPWRVLPRTRPMSEEEYRTIMSCPDLNRRFKELLEFLWRTGARPGEIAAIQARHLDVKLPIVRLRPSEHKTGRTGKHREIFMPPDLMDRLRDYAKDRPKGALLRNTRGNPWNADLISVTFGAIKKRLGLSSDLVIYMARHAFATRLVKPGADLALIAKLLGHGNAEVLQKTYYHPDTDSMASMVAEEFKNDGEETARIHQEVERARKERAAELKRQSYARCKAKAKADTPPDA